MKNPNAQRRVRNFLFLSFTVSTPLSLALILPVTSWSVPADYWLIGASWVTGVFGVLCFVSAYLLQLSVINDSN